MTVTTELTPEQIADNARKGKADKPPKPPSGKKGGAKGSPVHDDALDLSVAEAQAILRANDDAIIAKAISDQEASDRNLYLRSRVAASQNDRAFFESIDYQNLSDRAAKKTANILQPVQAQRQLAGAAQPESVPVPTVNDFLDKLEAFLGDDDE